MRRLRSRSHALPLAGLLASALGTLPVRVSADDVTNVALTTLSSGSLSVGWSIASVSTPTIVLSANEFSTTISSGLGSLGQAAVAFSNLSANTSYWFQVKNSTKPDSEYAGFNAAKATSTLAAAPLTIAFPFTGVAVSSFSVGWESVNGAGIRFEVIRSTGASPQTNGFFGNVTSATANTSAIFSGLAVNTSHFIAARAINNNSVPTAYTNLGSTATLAQVPTPGSPTGIAAGQITATWGDSGNPAGTRYLAVIALDSAFASVAGSSLTANSSATFSGLSANTTYFSQVVSVNFVGGVSTAAVLTATSTLAVPPVAAALSGVTASSIQANWTAGGNGAGIRYEAVLSTGAGPGGNAFSGNIASVTAATSVLFGGLGVNTTYHVEVRAINNNGLLTAFASLGSTVTLPNAPVAAALSGVTTGQVIANWSPNSNPAGTRFLARIATDSALSAVVGSSLTLSTATTFGGLSANVTYFLDVMALNFVGGFTSAVSLGSTSTWAVPPGTASFSGVSVSSIQANWTSAGNGAGVRYEAVLSTGASPGANGFGGNKTSTTTAVSAAFSALVLTTVYHVEVRAVNNNSVPTAYTSLGSTKTAAAAQSVAAGDSQTITLSAASGPVVLEIAPGAFVDAVSVAASVPASFPAPGAGLQATGVGVEITLTPPVQPVGTVNLSVGYTEPLRSGLDETKFVLARHDPGRGVWVPLVSTPDPAANAVSARLPHFSTFQIMQVDPADDLSRVKVFPNPFRPGSGHAGVTFINLPAAAKVRLYGVLGGVLRELNANASGMATWNGRDESGRPAASGVYLALIEGSGARGTFKVVVER